MDEVCTECDRVCYTGKICWRCEARLAGKKCSTCGSPWIWITVYPDDRYLCRVCMITLINEKGYNKGWDEYVRKWQTSEKERKAKVVKTTEEDAKILEMQRKLNMRKKPKTEEMFKE